MVGLTRYQKSLNHLVCLYDYVCDRSFVKKLYTVHMYIEIIGFLEVFKKLKEYNICNNHDSTGE